MDVGAVSREVATLDELSTESLPGAELLPLDSSEPSDEDPADSRLLVVSASLLTLCLRTSFMLMTEEDREVSALWAEATREI